MRGGLPDVNSKLNEPMSNNFNIEQVKTFLTSNNIDLPDNIDTITYIDMRRYVSEKDTTTDMNISNEFNRMFPIPKLT